MAPQKQLNITQIGKRIADRRAELHHDQEAIAERAGLSRAYISRLERGIVPNPKVVDLAAVADALNLSLDHLIYGRGSDPEDTADLYARLRRVLDPRLGEAVVRLDMSLPYIEQGDFEAAVRVLHRIADGARPEA